MQRTALRAAADAERSAQNLTSYALNDIFMHMEANHENNTRFT